MGYDAFRDSEYERLRVIFHDGGKVPGWARRKFQLEDKLKDERLHPETIVALAEANLISNVKARENLGLPPVDEPAEPVTEWVGMSEVL